MWRHTLTVCRPESVKGNEMVGAARPMGLTDPTFTAPFVDVDEGRNLRFRVAFPTLICAGCSCW